MDNFLSEIDNFQITGHVNSVDLELYIAPWKILKDISTQEGNLISITIGLDNQEDSKTVLAGGALRRIETPEGWLYDIEVIAPEPAEDPVVEEDIKKFLYQCEPFTAVYAFNWAMDIRFEKSKCDFYNSSVYKVFDLIQAKVEEGGTLLRLELDDIDFRLSKIDRWFLTKLGYEVYFGPGITRNSEFNKLFYSIEW